MSSLSYLLKLVVLASISNSIISILEFSYFHCEDVPGLCPGQGAPHRPLQDPAGVSAQVRGAGQLREVEATLQDGLLLAELVHLQL